MTILPSLDPAPGSCILPTGPLQKRKHGSNLADPANPALVSSELVYEVRHLGGLTCPLPRLTVLGADDRPGRDQRPRRQSGRPSRKGHCLCEVNHAANHTELDCREARGGGLYPTDVEEPRAAPLPARAVRPVAPADEAVLRLAFPHRLAQLQLLVRVRGHREPLRRRVERRLGIREPRRAHGILVARSGRWQR